MTLPGQSGSGRLLARLRDRQLTLATAESLTGGLVAAAITSVPGASQAFRGGIVAYATEVKATVLGVPAQVLTNFGPVAAETAEAMAIAVQRLFGADMGISTTGVAGPDPVGDSLPGLAYVAASFGGGPVLVRQIQVSGDRREVRQACVAAALAAGLAVLERSLPPGDLTRE